MNWIYLKDTYHNVSNINKVKFNEDGSTYIYFVGDSSPTYYFELSDIELKKLKKLVNNDSTTDS